MFTMKQTRRAFAGMLAALVAAPTVDAAALSPLEAVLLPERPDAPAPASIPGFDTIDHVRAMLIVRTTDGRSGILRLDLAPGAPVTFRHMGGLQGEIPVPGNCLASFPNWFQREIGYAVLGALPATEEE